MSIDLEKIKNAKGRAYINYNGQQICVNDYFEYKQIEEELGIDLVTLLKAFQQGFVYLDIKENNKGISKIVKFEVGGILFDKKNKVWRLTNDDRYDGAYWGSIATTKNYGKTWALTKEELL